MTDFESGGTLGATGASGSGKRKTQAKELIGQASQTLKTEVQSFVSVGQDRVRAETQ